MATTKFNIGRPPQNAVTQGAALSFNPTAEVVSARVDELEKEVALLQQWLRDLYTRIGGDDGPLPIKGYAVAALPTVSKWGDVASFSSIIYVYDETGGAIPAFSDGTNWRRVSDRAIVA